MRNLLLALLVTSIGTLVTTSAHAQVTALPRAGWIATASSSNSGEGPQRAIDGSAGSRWTTGTPQTPGQWFKLDMLTPQSFAQITVDTGGSTGDFARGYEVYVSADGISWGTPVASGTGSANILTITFPPQTARYLSIVQTGDATWNWWSIHELHVYGGDPTPALLPLSRAAWIVSASSPNAGRAIDGDASTRWTTGAPQVPSGQFFTIDMQSSQTFEEITLDATGSDGDCPRGYAISVSDDGVNWSDPVTGVGTAPLMKIDFAPQTARFVKIAQTGSATNWWSIHELNLYGAESGPIPVALSRADWQVTASSSWRSDVPRNALDGDGTTRWSTGVPQSGTGDQWFQIDMLAPKTFTQITMDAGISTGDFPRSYQVFASNDPLKWGDPIASGSGTTQVILVAFPFQNARYIKIVQTGSAANWWSIQELNVYGVAPSILPRAGWVASASSTSGGDVAARAIDGNVKTRWSTGVPQVNGQWFQVDMGGPVTFSQISLNAGTSVGDQPRAYQVYAADNPTNWGPPIATGTGSSAIVLIAFAPRTARFVRVVQTGSSSTNWWSIHEFNVAYVSSVLPSVSGITTLGGRTVAVFTYENVAGENINIPHGVGNDLSIVGVSSPSLAQLPPEWFTPGTHPGVFAAPLDADDVTWTVAGLSASANLDSPVLPPVTRPEGQGVVLDGGTFVLLVPDPNFLFKNAIEVTENDGLITPGQFAGTFNVTHDGNAAYDVPLWVPPGRAGMQPNLSLNYDSGGGDGLLGVGFSVSGLSRIAVCSRTLASDEINEVPQLTGLPDRDAFCLDGEKLVVLPGNGIHQSVYRTEHDTFAKITRFQLGKNGGADSFEVRTKDGRIMHYGGAGATLVGTQIIQVYSLQNSDPPVPNPIGTANTAWLLKDITDRSGNKITFEYRNTDVFGIGPSELVIDTIRYTGFGSDPGLRYIKFVSTRKDDSRVSFLHGVELGASMRIDEIQMFAPSPGGTSVLGDNGVARLLRKYKMEYELAPLNGRTHLVNVKDCDGAGVCKNPIKFQWTDNNPQFVAKAPLQPGYADRTNNPDPLYSPELADINGDGRDDLIYLIKHIKPAGTSWRLIYRLAGENGEFGDETTLAATNGALDIEPIDGSNEWPLIPIDVDMDGRVDLVMHHTTTPKKGVKQREWRINTISVDANGTPKYATHFTDPFTDDAAVKIQPSFADLNGDGLPDMFRKIKNDDGSFSWEVAFNSASGFAAPVVVSPASDNPSALVASIRGDSATSLLFPDFVQTTGDPLAGKRLKAVSAFGTNVFSASTSLAGDLFYHFGDFNGDGLADAFANLEDGSIRIFINDGADFQAGVRPKLFGSEQAKRSAGPFQIQNDVGDYDQDGREDYFLFLSEHVIAVTPQFAGTILKDTELKTIDGAFIPGRAASAISTFAFAGTGDFNGDGLTDFMVADPPLNPSAPLGDPDSLVTFRPYVRVGPKADQVKLITTGLGGNISISYAPSNLKGGKSEGCTYPSACFKVGPWVVQDVTSDTGGVAMHDSYTFSGARSDLTGRGWLGFATQTVEHKAVTTPQETLISRTVTTFDNQTMVGSASGYHDFPFAGVPATVTTTVADAGKTLVNSRAVTYDIVAGTAAKGSTFAVAPVFEVIDAKEYPTADPSVKTSLSHSETTYGYDTHANQTSEQTVFADSLEVLTKGATFETNETDWLIGQPTGATVTSTTKDLVAASRSTVTVNDPHTGLPIHTTIQGGGGQDQQLDVTYVRNDFGQPLSMTSVDLKGVTRATAYSYDAENMFVASTTNALGQTTQQMVHPGLGVVVAAMDANGFRSTATVDGFGRPRSELAASGVLVTHSYQKSPASGISYQAVTKYNSGAVSVTKFDIINRPRFRSSLNFTGDAFNVVETRYDDLQPSLVSAVTVPAKVIDASTPATHMTYDLMGRIKTSTALDGAVTKYQYDAVIVTMTDARTHQTIKTMDQKGRPYLMESVVPDDEPNPGHHITTVTTYGPFDQVATVKDINGNVVKKLYDDLGRQTDLFDPDKGHEKYEYSAFGDLRQMTDGNASVHTYSRDLLGRMISETTADGVAAMVWDLAPGGIGSMANSTSPDGTAKRVAYNGADVNGTGLPASETLTIPADHTGAKDYTISTGYDGAGRVSTITYPKIGNDKAVTVTRGYGANGHLEVMKRGDVELWQAVERDEADRVHVELAGNNVVSVTDYFADSQRLKQIQSIDADDHVARTLSYTYDPVGNVATRSIDDVNERFGYDHLQRLTTWQQSVDAALNGEGDVFSYDDIDNMLSRARKSFAAGQPVGPDLDLISFTPGDGKTHGPHQLVTSTLGNYQYDPKGDQRGAPGRQVTFTTFGLPRHVDTASHSTRFLYDAAHNRVWKDGADGVVVSFGGLYEAEIHGDLTAHHLRVSGESGLAAEITISEANNFILSDSTTFLHQDHLGSTEAASDQTGHIVQRIKYDVFGKRQIENNAEPKTDIGFTGQKVDEDLDLIDMKGRAYDPKTARFISADPVVAAPLVGRAYNRYAYVFNNPMSMVDPSGFRTIHPKIAWGSSLESTMYAHSATGLILDGLPIGDYAGPTGIGPVTIVQMFDFLRGPTISPGSSGNNGTSPSSSTARAGTSQTGDEAQGGFLSERDDIQGALDLANDMENRGDSVSTNLLRQLAIEDAAASLNLSPPEGWVLGYDPGLQDREHVEANTDPLGHTVMIGDRALLSASNLGSTLIHEFTHVEQLMAGQYSSLGVQPGVYSAGPERFHYNEILALQAEISNAGTTGISSYELGRVQQLLRRATLDYAYGVTNLARTQNDLY